MEKAKGRTPPFCFSLQQQYLKGEIVMIKIRFSKNFDPSKFDFEMPPKKLVYEFVLECILESEEEIPMNESVAYFDATDKKVTAIFRRVAQNEYIIEEYFPCDAVIDVKEK